MIARRLVVSLALVAGAFVASPLPSYAAGPTDLYVAVASDGGSDTNACTQAEPCATVAHAIELSADTGTTIHVGAGTFDGEIEPGAKSVTIDGLSTGATTLTTPQDSGDGYVLAVTTGSTYLSALTVQGGLFVDVFVSGGRVDADHVVLGQAGCALVATGGEAHLTDSTVSDGGQGCITGPDPSDMGAGLIVVDDGTVSLVRDEVTNPTPRQPAVSVTGGDFSADQTLFDDSGNDLDTNDSDAVHLTKGTAMVTRSTLHGFGGSGVYDDGGTASLSDDTFQGDVVGVTGNAGPTTVVRATFQHELASLQGSVSVGGSLLGSMLGTPTVGIKECGNATVTDLGYNLSSDGTCGFTGTSRDNVADLGLDGGLADRGGPVSTVAILQPSAAVDAIPAGATYGDSATPFCAGTDLRGVPRPQAGACDAGSMEMVATVTTLQAPTTARPRTRVSLEASIDVSDVGVDGIDVPAGAVTFRSGSHALCSGVTVIGGTAQCSTSALTAGRRDVSAEFTPTDGSTLHPSTAHATVLVGTDPGVRGPRKVEIRVGQRVRVTLHVSGRPSPILTVVKGHLPRGLTFHTRRGKATITGIPRPGSLGRHHVRVRAVNLMGTSRHRLTLVVTRG
jgi:hypothetical protein